MPFTNFLLVIHILGAIAIFGVTFSFPFIGALAKKEGAPVAWALKLSDFIETKWVNPLALTIQPASGALLIVHNHFDPFKAQHRWLAAGIIIYIVAMFYAIFIQGRIGKKALHMAEANQFGPEFGALMKKLQMGGQFLTVLLITIVILMVTKPGSGFIHT
jgi:uncharacterized membrane protein